jgi:methylmalonyl-CoA mutase N-terminal domain/subunit
LTAQQPDNNIVRVAIQALAAVLGGTQSLHCNGRDEALALPTEAAAEIALRTQQIIASETGLADTVDPFGGSWAVESRTREIENGARALIASIDAAGGTLAAIERGWIQRQIQDAAYATQQAIDRGDQIIVGVNKYATGTPPVMESRQRRAVADLRRRRDANACTAALAAVERAAREGLNLVPPVIEAAEALATVGEISDALRRVFGEHRDHSA